MAYRRQAYRRQASTEETQRSRGFWDRASHDLRQPVQSLQLLAHVFARGEGDEAMREGAQHMRRVVDDLARMHAALLRLVRLECGGAAPGRGAVSLGPLVAEIVQSLAEAARERKTTLRAERIEGSVEADAEALALLLRGLVVLALRYGGGEEVAVRARRSGDGVSIAIDFEGEGIPAEESGAVFLEAAGSGEKRAILGPGYLLRLSEALGYGLALGEGEGAGRRFSLTVPGR